MAENFVLQELRAGRHSEVFSLLEENYELDFLLPADGDFLGIEVKAGENTKDTKSLSFFMDRYETMSAILMSGEPEKSRESNSRLQRKALYQAGWV